jgi:hypothetical protein
MDSLINGNEMNIYLKKYHLADGFPNNNSNFPFVKKLKFNIIYIIPLKK